MLTVRGWDSEYFLLINEMEIKTLRGRTANCRDRFIHHTSGSLTLLQCDRAALQVLSPRGAKLMADRDERAAYGHTPGQRPNEILRPGGTR